MTSVSACSLFGRTAVARLIVGVLKVRWCRQLINHSRPHCYCFNALVTTNLHPKLFALSLSLLPFSWISAFHFLFHLCFLCQHFPLDLFLQIFPSYFLALFLIALSTPSFYIFCFSPLVSICFNPCPTTFTNLQVNAIYSVLNPQCFAWSRSKPKGRFRDASGGDYLECMCIS